MSIVEAIRTRLLAISGVTALVLTRVHAQVLPQSPTLPALRVQRVSEVEDMHQRGSAGLLRARVQVDTVTTSNRAAAVAIDEAVDGNGAGSGLKGWRGVVGSLRIVLIEPAGVREGFDAEELQQYKIMRDYFVHFKKA